ncbi:MAG: SDR family NAD(P)-dependent oxidoreductase [Thermotogae bacterium]|nr:SDR family NAD(P)-dependent oxidoreductase [Thermotogota bacterium]
MNLEGKGVLLTGATRGIGRETLKLLVAEGSKVVAVGRDEDRLRELKRIKNVIPLQADLSDPGQRANVVGIAAETLGGLDILINNAGFGINAPLLETDDERLRQLCEVNFWAPLHLTRASVPFLRNEGVILNVISMIAFVPLRKWAMYSASKAALRSLFLALREELRTEGIKVINVYPPVTRTDFFKTAGSHGIKGIGSVSPDRVARVIVKALKRGKEEVFVSPWDRFLATLGIIFSPLTTRIIGE